MNINPHKLPLGGFIKFLRLLDNSRSTAEHGTLDILITIGIIISKGDNIGYVIPTKVLAVDLDNLILINIDDLNKVKAAFFLVRKQFR